MIRVRLDKAPVSGTQVTLDGAQSHHLTTVLRVKEGEAIEALAADGSRWSCVVLSVSAPLVLEVQGLYQGPDADPVGQLRLAIPTLKGGRTDDLVRSLTELGVAEILIYSSLRSVARPPAGKVDKKLARWTAIAEGATRQCGRCSVPRVTYEEGLPEGGASHAFLWEEAQPSARAASVLAGCVVGGSLTILVGPEGGLDPTEGLALRAAGWQPASLGPRLLRAETAAAAAAVLGLVALGERGYS
jgi:16S rRNA (uracil1498-N3)-methyltransferase